MRPGISLFFFLLNSLLIRLQAQPSYVLPEIEITDSVKSIFYLYPENMVNRTTRISPRHSISHLLAEQTHTFVRHYGPGRLATISQKGASPQQTAILYKGFNMQNPTLGLTDVSLYSSFLFDRIHSGGNSSAVYGSGIANNGIHLASSVSNEDEILVTSRYGSLGHFFQGISLQDIGLRTHTILKAYYDRADNDLKYTGLAGLQKRLPHAGHRQGGFLIDQTLLLVKGHHLNLFGTHTFAHREIPPTRLQSISEALQDDQAGRYGFVYQHFKHKRVISLRGMWMVDRVNYQDPATNTDSRNIAHAIQVISRYIRKWNENSQFLVQLDWMIQDGRSKVYNTHSVRNQVSMNLALKKQIPALNTALSASGRIQWNELSGTEFLPFLEAKYSFSGQFEAFLQVQRTFRVPSLDDLFWTPGGNPELKPESGWHEELGIRYLANSGKWHHEVKGSFYYRNMQNWILWIPVNSQVWSPQNIARVQSRGIELTYSGNWDFGNVQFVPRFLYTYQNVIEFHSDPFLANRDGNYLVYMPDHQLKAMIQVSYKKFGLGIHQYLVSRSFADPQNVQVVPGYQVINCSAAYTTTMHNIELTGQVSVENLFNSEYEVIANYPMPGRLLYISVNAKFRK